MFTLFTQTRHSYGVIPLRSTERGIECLLIDQKDSNAPVRNEYWTFPKGTPEKGETGMETAIRETREETGIEFADIDPDFICDDQYTFSVGFTKIHKTVTYYIGRTEEGEVIVQEKEVRGYAWLPLRDARAKLTNDHARLIIDAIVTHLPASRLFVPSPQ
jgi:8-oxo-dGTP pyrophosphatase MutT (NUDIX family)